jgi:hypothetical protein
MLVGMANPLPGPTAVDPAVRVSVAPGWVASTVKVSALEVIPPGFSAVMLALPCEAIRLAATVAVSCVELTKVVGRAELFH